MFYGSNVSETWVKRKFLHLWDRHLKSIKKTKKKQRNIKNTKKKQKNIKKTKKEQKTIWWVSYFTSL